MRCEVSVWDREPATNVRAFALVPAQGQCNDALRVTGIGVDGQREPRVIVTSRGTPS
jgi:hypothetical protein